MPSLMINYYYYNCMLFTINVPQSKAVSIAFTSLKSMILGLVITVTSSQIWKEQQ